MPGQVQVLAPGNGLKPVVAHQFLVQSKTAQMELGRELRLIFCSGKFRREIQASPDGDRGTGQAGNGREVEVVSGKVELKASRTQVVGAAAGNAAGARDGVELLELRLHAPEVNQRRGRIDRVSLN